MSLLWPPQQETSSRASGRRTWSSPTPGFLPERAARTSPTSPNSSIYLMSMLPGAAHRARHRGAAPAGGHSVADGARLGAAARDAWLAVRPVRVARAAQAARRGYLTLAGIRSIA